MLIYAISQQSYDFILFCIRWGLSILVLYGAVILFLISARLLKTRLAKHTWTLGLALLAFFIARTIAAILDAIIIYPFGMFSTIVTYTYWTWIDIFLTRRYMRLRSEDLGEEGIRRIAQNYDEVLLDMKMTRRQLLTGAIKK